MKIAKKLTAPANFQINRQCRAGIIDTQRHKTMKLSVRQAEPADNRAILELLDRNPVPGSVEVVMQCRPSFYQAQQVKGDVVQVGIGEEKESGAVVGVGVRTIATLYVDSRPVRVGYLSGLRIDRPYRGSSLLARGFRYLKELDKDRQCDFYLTTIVDDNEQAKELLTSRRAALPDYIDWGRFCTAYLYPNQRRKQVRHGRSVSFYRATGQDREELFSFLNRQGADKQFFPVLQTADLTGRLQTTRLQDWYLLRENGELVAAALQWDQTAFRQTVITGYHGLMRFACCLSRAFQKLSFVPTLPAAGEVLQQFYLSFCTVRNNDPDLFSILLDEIYTDTLADGQGYGIVGFHETDPLLSCLQGVAHKKYWSRLYLVSWNGVPQIDPPKVRTPFLEVACL